MICMRVRHETLLVNNSVNYRSFLSPIVRRCSIDADYDVLDESERLVDNGLRERHDMLVD